MCSLCLLHEFITELLTSCTGQAGHGRGNAIALCSSTWIIVKHYDVHSITVHCTGQAGHGRGNAIALCSSIWIIVQHYDAHSITELYLHVTRIYSIAKDGMNVF